MIRLTRLAALVSFGAFMAAHGQTTRTAPLTMSEQGVGPITPTTPADRLSIAKLLPGFRVIKGVSSSEGVEFPTIRVMDGAGELFIVAPDTDQRTIYSIVVSSPRVTYDGKIKVGSLYSEVFGNRVPAGCSMGMEEDSGHLICPASPDSHVRFVFTGGGARDDATIPSPAVLKRWRVKEMFWHPKG